MKQLCFSITVQYEESDNLWGGSPNSQVNLNFRVPLEMYNGANLSKMVEQAIADAKAGYPEAKKEYDERQAKYEAERLEREAKKLAEQEAV